MRSQFAVGVGEAIAKASAVSENIQYSTPTTTGAVRMDFPPINSEDCILWLDVGDVNLFESVLFPGGLRLQDLSHSGKFLRLPPRGTRGTKKRYTVTTNVSYTIKRACLAAATLIFGSQLCEAIDTSQLRTWEKDKAGLTDTTDCITMEVHDTHEPRYRTLRLRLEFLRGLRIAQHLFADQNTSSH